jgi:YVTN family beta-propeller protein
VTASGSDEVLVVDPETRAVLRRLPVARRPRGIAWRPDGSAAWVTHLVAPGGRARLTNVFPATWSTSATPLPPGPDDGAAGVPTVIQGLAVAPGRDELWIAATRSNHRLGLLAGEPFTPEALFHPVVLRVDVSAHAARHDSTAAVVLDAAGGPAPVSGPVALAFLDGRAFVANLHAGDVSVLRAAPGEPPSRLATIDVGDAPIGVAADRGRGVVWVASWLSRDVSVLDGVSLEEIARVPSARDEPLPPDVLRGKRLFFSSAPPMARDHAGACASCHPFGGSDGLAWDLSQLGKRVRATPDLRGGALTGAHDWTADRDEMADHEHSILDFTGGEGFTGDPHPPLGPPNDGRSPELDDLGRYLATLRHRPSTPFRNPDGTLTAEARAGREVFAAAGCAACHAGPHFTDSRRDRPLVRHDVGTAHPDDADAAAGFDTPSLVGVWDRAPYLHDASAPTLRDVLTTRNPDDRHGATSGLSEGEIDRLVAWLRQIARPEEASPLSGPGARR